jgi:hypothetical protein
MPSQRFLEAVALPPLPEEYFAEGVIAPVEFRLDFELVGAHCRLAKSRASSASTVAVTNATPNLRAIKIAAREISSPVFAGFASGDTVLDFHCRAPQRDGLIK